MTENLDVRDNISISLRRDENTAAVKKLVDEAPGRDFTEKVMTSIQNTFLDSKFDSAKLPDSELRQLHQIAERQGETKLLRELEEEISKRNRGEKCGKNKGS